MVVLAYRALLSCNKEAEGRIFSESFKYGGCCLKIIKSGFKEEGGGYHVQRRILS